MSIERQVVAIERQMEVENQKERLLVEKMRRCIDKGEKIKAEKCPVPWFLWVPLWIPWKMHQQSRFRKTGEEAQEWADKANVHVARIRELNGQLLTLRMKF